MDKILFFMKNDKISTTYNSKLLLIIDPEQVDANLEVIISGLGVEFLTANNEDYKIVAENYEPDIVLADKSLTIETFKEICTFFRSGKKFAEIPIVAVIGDLSPENIGNVLGAGANDFVISPIYPPELRSRLCNQFNIVNFRREWKNELFHLERLNKEKNEILAIAAHDLKNPIFSIQLLGKTIRDDISLTKDEIFEFSNDIVASCERIIDIIKQLLDLNSIESGKISIDIRQHNIIESVKHLIELYRYKSELKNIKVHLDCNSDGEVRADLVSFNNIFDNFLSNAIKYSPFNKDIFIRLNDINNKLVLCVEDRGPGIPIAEQEKLFKRFAKISNKPTGGENSTGLGLSIVKKFVELIDAELEFKNNENTEGATFKVIIPKH